MISLLFPAWLSREKSTRYASSIRIKEVGGASFKSWMTPSQGGIKNTPSSGKRYTKQEHLSCSISKSQKARQDFPIPWAPNMRTRESSEERIFLHCRVSGSSYTVLVVWHSIFSISLIISFNDREIESTCLKWHIFDVSSVTCFASIVRMILCIIFFG